MAVSAFFAATVEDDDPSVRRAGWVYLIATHLGTLCLIAMFALLRRATGAFAFEPPAVDSTQQTMFTMIFVLAVIGFGFKAGLFPLHVWLPEAHANAPSHVSAVMSGVMLKMGVYGIVRISDLLPEPPAWWGGLLLGVGAGSGILGIVFALGQRDLKRLLAYSSIENIGIIAMGVGLALVGRSVNRMDLVVLGLAGALFHVWNHSLFKSLLFLNAGAIIHGVHTREIDRLGGLARRMPRTALLFLLGSAAICALPPLNGFAGEWLLYLGLFRSSGAFEGAAIPAAALGASVLATIGALAVACFVKLFGAIFLGQPRSDLGSAAHDPERSMSFPIVALAIGCVTLGVSPWLAAPMLDRAVAAWRGPTPSAATPILELAPMSWISLMAGASIGISAMIAVAMIPLRRAQRAESAGTWDCGYARPTARMQYTGSSFGQTIVGLFGWALWPRVDAARIRGMFPQAAFFHSHVPETILDRLVLPVLRFAERCISHLRLFQQGSIQVYLVYFVAAVLVLLFWGRFGF
jgi:hydrogenase-4 component B